MCRGSIIFFNKHPQYTNKMISKESVCIFDILTLLLLGSEQRINPNQMLVHSQQNNNQYYQPTFRMQRKKKITNYTIFMDNKLGEGAFGKVYVGEQDKTKLKVAVKVLQKKTVDSDQYIKSALFSEIEVLKCLKSPNIVGFLDVMQSSNYYYIIQQFCDGGELRQYMKKKGKIPETEAIEFLTQICNGFVELIKEGVMHRDLKPQNVLIHQKVLKIADFGFSKKGQQLKKVAAQTMVGTPLYMSLQVLKSKPYSSKCDIWSLGFIFFEMMMGRTPWTGNSEYELIRNIQKQPLSFPIQLTDVTKDFIRRCCALEQKNRFSWDQLLRHPIFKGRFSTKDKQFENKYKAIMNHIRYQIKSKNIDLQNIFEGMGYSKASPMIYKSFQQMMKGIDPQLTDQQIYYIFNKINESGSGAITVDEFNVAIDKFHIPKSVIKSPAATQQLNLKVANAFQKLITKLTQQNKTLFQVFDAYKLTQKGMIDLSDYDRLMTVLDPSFTKSEIQAAFSIFDHNNTKNVPLKQFIDYFTSVTGWVPVQNISNNGVVRKDSINSDTSATIAPLYSNNPHQQMPNIQNLQGPAYYNQQAMYQQQQQQQQQLLAQQQYQQQQLQQQQQQQQQNYLYHQQQIQGGNLGGQYVYSNGYGVTTDAYGQQYRY